MTITINRKLLLAATLPLFLAACGGGESAKPADEHGEEEAGHADEGKITLTNEQIKIAGIALGRPTVGNAGALQLPATIEGDPQGTQAVSAAIGGRVVALNRNLGQSVGRG